MLINNTLMIPDTVIILIIVALALFLWVPAIIWSVRQALKKDKKAK